jgi:amidase
MIRTAAIASLLALAILPATAQTPQLTGNWTFLADVLGTPIYARLTLNQQGDKLTGDLNGDKLEGTVTGNQIHFVSKDNGGGSDTVQGTLSNGTITGDYIEVDGNDLSHPAHYTFTATLAPPLQHLAPQRHDFTPTIFYRQFSPFYKPVLTVNPGDTIHTTTVDAGGTDEHGVNRVLGGPAPSTFKEHNRETRSSSTWFASNSTATTPSATTTSSAAYSTPTWPSK